MGFKALVIRWILLLIPGAPQLLQNESTLWGLFPIKNELSVRGKQQKKPELWLQTVDLWEAKEVRRWKLFFSHWESSKNFQGVYTDFLPAE